jgi:hypothetical protein
MPRHFIVVQCKVFKCLVKSVLLWITDHTCICTWLILNFFYHWQRRYNLLNTMRWLYNNRLTLSLHICCCLWSFNGGLLTVNHLRLGIQFGLSLVRIIQAVLFSSRWLRFTKKFNIRWFYYHWRSWSLHGLLLDIMASHICLLRLYFLRYCTSSWGLIVLGRCR